MSDEQKVLFKQLQLAGLGIVLILFGLFMHEKNISFGGSFTGQAFAGKTI